MALEWACNDFIMIMRLLNAQYVVLCATLEFVLLTPGDSNNCWRVREEIYGPSALLQLIPSYFSYSVIILSLSRLVFSLLQRGGIYYKNNLKGMRRKERRLRPFSHLPQRSSYSFKNKERERERSVRGDAVLSPFNELEVLKPAAGGLPGLPIGSLTRAGSFFSSLSEPEEWPAGREK